MGRIRTLTRRSFLVGSTAVLGGVAFGTYMAAKPVANPLLAGLKDGEAAFNPYVKITGDGITLIVNHADKGQGVQSAQAVLIAEELDVDLDQVSLSFGQPDPAYYNTGFAAEAVPFMSFDYGMAAKTMRSIAGSALKLMGLQGTGGSTSMPDQFVKLRTAGAVARETLKQAASDQSGIAVADLKTERGAVILPDGTALAYTALAARAATLEPRQDVTLRDPSQWRLIGKPMARTDMVGKVTGTQDFSIDLQRDGMVYATVRINPHKGGAVNGFDAKAAEAMRGVQKVMAVKGGVAVVADNTWRAFQAAEAIDIDWGQAAYPAEQADHWAEIGRSFVPERLDKEWRNDGDVDANLLDAPLTAEYRAPYVAHAPLEPLSALVRVANGKVDVWTGHQTPGFLVMKVAELAGVTADDVTFHNQFMGGSFGHRLELDFVLQATEIAMALDGTPVKMTYSREEDFAQDFPRHIGMARASGAVKDGKVDAWALDVATPSPINSQMGRLGFAAPGPDAQIAAGAWNMPYDVPNLRVRAYRVPELAPVSSWRSVGASSAGFFAECFLDELIHAAGADPFEERLRLINHPVHREVLKKVGEIAGWYDPMDANQGRGIALVESFGVPVATIVEVTATEDGIKIDRVSVAADVGTVIDPVNLEAQLMGGTVWGLGHAMNCEITYADGMAEQANFYDHEGMRMAQCPVIEVRALENGRNIRGAGEPAVPPAAPALANAIFAATGTRLREMPFAKTVDFV